MLASLQKTDQALVLKSKVESRDLRLLADSLARLTRSVGELEMVCDVERTQDPIVAQRN